MGEMMYDTSTMWMMCIMMGIGIIIFIIVLGATIYLVTRLLMKKTRVDDSPLKLLKERFVKGKISEDEYIQKRKVFDESKK